MAIPTITTHNLNVRPFILVSPSFNFRCSLFSTPFYLKTHSKDRFFSNIPPRIYQYQNPPLTLTRRLFLPSVSGIWDALTGGSNNAHEAVLAIRRGMLLFRQGDVSGSLAEFDEAIRLVPRQKAYLWQRGLSLYYLDRFEDGAEQFRLDVAQNPNDTEESMWCFLCEAQLYGVDEARKRFLEVGRDPRPVMRAAYNMFKDGGDPEQFVAGFSNGRENEYFYASLYAGLYYESQHGSVEDARFAVKSTSWTKKETDAAERHILAACQSPYGQRSDDYMASLAKVHVLCRNWAAN